MSSLIEEDPEYPARVAEYLQKTRTRALPWGSIVVSGHLTWTTSHAERRARQEMGETALVLLGALGVDGATVDALVGTPADRILATFEALRGGTVDGAETL